MACGDLNADPVESHQAIPRSAVDARVVAPDEPTCFGHDGRANVRDYFVASTKLVETMLPPEVQSGAAIPTHRPVRIKFLVAPEIKFLTSLRRPGKSRSWSCSVPGGNQMNAGG